MREVIFDTETTGLDPSKGHRLVEIGCVEILNGIPTGRTFHRYLDPQRDMPEDAFNVHGISAEMLAGKPLFADVADEFLAFTEGARLVAHNAEFDFRFMNAELLAAGRPELDRERMVDTLALARRRHPGSPVSLDALCSRYGIDTSRRTKHGALLDSEILAEVYAELTGGRQTSLVLDGPRAGGGIGNIAAKRGPRPTPIGSTVRPEERAAHESFVAGLGEAAVWRRYAGSGSSAEEPAAG